MPEPEWLVMNTPDYTADFEVGDQAVLVTRLNGKLQATAVEIQTWLDPDRHGRRAYSGKVLDSNVLPEGTVTKFTCLNTVKPIS